MEYKFKLLKLNSKIENLIKKLEKDDETHKELLEFLNSSKDLIFSNCEIKEEMVNLLNVNKSSSTNNEEIKSDNAIVDSNNDEHVYKNDQHEHYKINKMRNQINSIQSFLKLE